MTGITLAQLSKSCEDKRVENTAAYRQSVKESNKKIQEYQLRQASMYRKSADWVGM